MLRIAQVEGSSSRVGVGDVDLTAVTETVADAYRLDAEEAGHALVSDRRIGVIAQSGGIGFALFNRGTAAGIGFSYVISTGNEADLNMSDFLDYMVEDKNTHAVMLFCETVRNGPGSTTSTLIPSGATSFASASERPSTANLVAL